MYKTLPIFAVLVLAAAATIFFAFNPGDASHSPAVVWSNVSSTSPATAPASAAPQGYKTYTNTQYKFSLFYPADVSPKEYNEQGGAHTIAFENVAGDMGFQIYVTPYAQGEISPERFKLDEPSGVREQPTDIYIDSTRAAMFFSENALMGKTREVWFIKNGFLYEVVTYKALDAWLSQIMSTWRFI